MADKLQKVSEQTGQTATQIFDSASKYGRPLIDLANKGNVNIYVQRAGDLDKLTRITTNPSITKVISAGTLESTQAVKTVLNGRQIPMNVYEVGKFVVNKLINYLK